MISEPTGGQPVDAIESREIAFHSGQRQGAAPPVIYELVAAKGQLHGATARPPRRLCRGAGCTTGRASLRTQTGGEVPEVLHIVPQTALGAGVHQTLRNSAHGARCLLTGRRLQTGNEVDQIFSSGGGAGLGTAAATSGSRPA